MALAAGVALAVAAFLVMPNKGPGPAEIEGDAELTAMVTDFAAGHEEQIQGMSVVVVEGEERASVVAGTADGETPITADTPFETGSVFKVFTAMTLAELVDSGETSLERTLGEIFAEVDFADPKVAEITLAELASHRSGLPPVPSEGTLAAGVAASLTATDPYRGLPANTEALATARATTRGEWAYSNFGYAVLGEALERESGTPYPELVRERVLDPLGMDATFILGADTGEIPEGAALPHLEAGARSQAWNHPPYAPAGVGTWTTANDLVRFLTAVMDGTAPGMAAVEPAYEGPGEETRLGLAWMTTELDGGAELTFHDGATYGSTAFVGYSGQRGMVALSNSFSFNAGLVAPHVRGEEDPPTMDDPDTRLMRTVALAITLAITLAPPLLAVTLVLRRRTLVGQRPLDRLRIVSMPLGAMAVLVAAQRAGTWTSVPPALWALAVGLVGASLAVGLWYWPRVAVVRARWRWVRVCFFVASVTVSVALAATMTWALAVSNV